MKIAQLRKMDISNGTGIGISIFTQGCPYHCKGCHNTVTWSTDKGEYLTQENKNKFLSLLDSTYITRVSILGGEPLLPQNVAELASLICDIKKKRTDVKIWLWTGATFEDLYNLAVFKQPSKDNILNNLGWNNDNLPDLIYILNHIDYMIDGRFIQEQKDLTLKFRGSTNQRWLDMPQSLKAGIAVSMDD